MKRWWQLWSGHVLAGLTAVLLYFAFVFTIESMRSMDSDSMFWNFVVAVLFFLLAAIVGIMSTWRFKTHQERYYIRRQDALESLSPLITGEETWDESSAAGEAHSDSQEGSRA